MHPDHCHCKNTATHLRGFDSQSQLEPKIMHLSQLALMGFTAFSTLAYAEHLRAVFSSGAFSTISGPSGGSLSKQMRGFAILNVAGDAIYTQKLPDGHSPCYTGGREFTIEGKCWARARKFHCVCNLAGNVQNCAVKGHEGTLLGSSEGKTDTTFIGIAITQESTCVVAFESEPAEGYGGCPTVGRSGKGSNLKVTSG
jgi:hypothetical protein